MVRKANVKLSEIYPKYSAPDGGGDKGTAHSYLEIYEEYLDPSKSLLEVGVWQGHSLAMFEEFFRGYVMGLDVDLSRKKYGKNAVFCDATNRIHVKETLKDRKFDYIIDDGSHRIEDQLKSLELLWPYLAPEGVYFIEDIRSMEALETIQKAAHELSKDWESYDLRENKGRSDDILIAIRKVE